MKPDKNKVFVIAKWIVMVTAYGFLFYKLANITYWNELKKTFQEMNFERLALLAGVILLMPANWLLEAAKWQKLTEKTTPLSIKTSLKSVLAGLSTGYITPNRIGDFAGRVLFLPKEKQLSGILLSIVNSLTQNIVITIFGLIGAVFYFANFKSTNSFSHFLFWIGAGFAISLLLYFSFPKLAKYIKTGSRSSKFQEIMKSMSGFRFRDLMAIISISMLRYFVFCLQYYLLLCFFGITIPFQHAVSAIPAMYLLVTFTPSLAASEPAIRGSYAVLIFSVFSADIIGIMLTGVLTWLINFVIPMATGTIVIGKTKTLQAGSPV